MQLGDCAAWKSSWRPLSRAGRWRRGGGLSSDAGRLVPGRGDLRRRDRRFTPLRYAAQLMAFLGLVPGERSTGDSVRRKGLTLAGNRRARRALIEGLDLSLSRPGQRDPQSPARGIAEGGARHRPEGAGSTVRPLPPAQRGRQEAAGGRGCDRARDGRIPLGHRPRDRTRVEAVFLSLLHKAGGGATVGNSRR
jgi:Transposase IS116/IS110/IS902 family